MVVGSWLHNKRWEVYGCSIVEAFLTLFVLAVHHGMYKKKNNHTVEKAKASCKVEEMELRISCPV